MEQLLEQVKTGMEAKIPPELQDDTQRMVIAGKKIMFDAKTHQLMMTQLNQPGDIVENVAKGIGALMSIIFRSSKGTPPIDASIPAAILLMCEALDFLAQTGRLELTPDTLAQCTKAVMAYMMQKLGLTPEKIQELQQGAGNKAEGLPDLNAAQPSAQPPQAGGLINAAQGAQ